MTGLKGKVVKIFKERLNVKPNRNNVFPVFLKISSLL